MTDLTGMDGTARMRFVQYKQRIYLFNGRNRMRKFDGIAFNLAGIDTWSFANFAPTGTLGGTGITGRYRYFLVAANSKNLDALGRPVESLPSLISAEVNAVNQTVTINNIPATHPDPQVDTWNIYRNKDGVYDTDLNDNEQDFFIVGSVAIGTTTFADNFPDSELTGAPQIRFEQSTPRTFKDCIVYGDRLFSAGFDPINEGTATVNADPTKIDFSGVTIPDGVKGCWFRKDGDTKQYEIQQMNTTSQIQLEESFVGSLSGATYSIYMNPWEIDFSEMFSPEARGLDGERNMLELPGQQHFKGFAVYQGNLLVFTPHDIYIITGQGPDTTDIKLLPAPIYSGLGALSGDAICQADNEIHFLSSRGPAVLAGGGEPRLTGLQLNTDWLDGLTADNAELACMGTNDNNVYLCVSDALLESGGVPYNQKCFRYERATQSWWPETEIHPTFFARQDGDNGETNILYYAQDRFVIQPEADPVQQTKFDLLANAFSGAAVFQETIHVAATASIGDTEVTIDGSQLDIDVGDTLQFAGDSTVYTINNIGGYPTLDFDLNLVAPLVIGQAITLTHVQPDTTSMKTLASFPTTGGGLEQCYIRFYRAGVLLARRLIISNESQPGGPLHGSVAYALVTWSSSSDVPGNGALVLQAGDTFEIGNICWDWLTKSHELPGHLKYDRQIEVTFNSKDLTGANTYTLLRTDILNGIETTGAPIVMTSNQIASQYDISRANREYAARIGSRNGVVVRHLTIQADVEATTV